MFICFWGFLGLADECHVLRSQLCFEMRGHGPVSWQVGCYQEWHFCLLWCFVGFPVVAGAAGEHGVLPGV